MQQPTFSSAIITLTPSHSAHISLWQSFYNSRRTCTYPLLPLGLHWLEPRFSAMWLHLFITTLQQPLPIFTPQAAHQDIYSTSGNHGRLFLLTPTSNSSNYSKPFLNCIPPNLPTNPWLHFHLVMLPMLRNPSFLSASNSSNFTINIPKLLAGLSPTQLCQPC